MPTYEIAGQPFELDQRLPSLLKADGDMFCGFTKYDVLASVGSGSVYLQKFASGCYHIYFNVRLDEVSTFQFTEAEAQTTHSLSSIRGSTNLIIGKNSYEEDVREHCNVVFRGYDGGGFQIKLTPHTKYRVSLIHLGRFLIEDLVQPYCETQLSFLLPEQGDKAQKVCCLGPVASFNTSFIVNATFTSKLLGVARTAYIHGKTMEVVALQLDLAERIFNGEAYTGPLSEQEVQLALRARDIIMIQYADDLTIRSLSKQLATNQQKLKTVFKSFFDITINRYIKKVRIEVAKSLLLSGQYTVGEASTAVGYANQSHFAARFKEIVGVNPSELLNRSSFELPDQD